MLSVLTVAKAQSDEVKIKELLNNYKSAIEKLDATGTEKLFTATSQVIESGSVEGTYAHYLEHHLGPELKDFTSFAFDNYKVDVTVSGDFAYAVETYNYSIVLKKDNSEHKRKGVATSVLIKEEEGWRITHMHNSSRKP